MRKLDHVKPRNHLAVLRKRLQGKTDGLGMNKKRIDLRQQPLSLKELMLTLVLKEVMLILAPRRLNEIGLNRGVASTKPHISKKNKMSQLKFATEHVIWTEEYGIVFLSAMSQFNLFDCDGRRFVQRSSKELYSPQCTKSSVKFGRENEIVFGMIFLLVQDLLSGYTVKLTQLSTKRYGRNMYLI